MVVITVLGRLRQADSKSGQPGLTVSSWALLFHFHSTPPFSVNQSHGSATTVPGVWTEAQVLKDIVSLYPRVWIPCISSALSPMSPSHPPSCGEGGINTSIVEG